MGGGLTPNAERLFDELLLIYTCPNLQFFLCSLVGLFGSITTLAEAYDPENFCRNMNDNRLKFQAYISRTVSAKECSCRSDSQTVSCSDLPWLPTREDSCSGFAIFFSSFLLLLLCKIIVNS